MEMKKQILSIVFAVATILVSTTSYASGKTSEKANSGYVVHSVINGREAMTAYDKKGKWVYTVQQYNPNNLDENIVDRVRSVYYQYGVTSIQKVEQPGMDAVYVVRLENTKSIKIIRLTSDDMEVVQDLIKG
jgi:predicted small secreted protein